MTQRRYEGIEDRGAALMADAGIARRAGLMLLRGQLRKPLFGTSKGSLFVGRGTRLSGLRHVHHDGRLVIEDGVELQGTSHHGVRFGADVSLGSRTAIRPSSYYGGPAGEGMTMGDRSSLGTGCFVGCSGTVTIGDDVMVGPHVMLFSENHVFAEPGRTIKSQGVERGTLDIEDDCWIGAGSIVVSGVTVGQGSVVAAGSVVTHDVPAFAVVAGVPAKVISFRGSPEGVTTS